jgi:dihydroflavonol-4-reductase
MKGRLMKRAFVTGATGLLGSNLVMQLLDEGYAVRALVRSIEKGKRQFSDPRVELIVGDMLNVSAFAASLEGVDVLFHAAAYFRESFGPGDHEAQLERINVRGTLELLDAAYGKGITNVVYVSALGVLQRPSDGSPFDEHSPYSISTQNAYFKSKISAEQALEQWLSTHLQMRVVLILPAGMWGPRDAAPTSFGQFTISFLKGQMPIILPGAIPFVDARDVASAMIRAVHTGASGERFIVSQRMVTVAEIVRGLAKVSGKAAPRVRLSFPIATVFALIAETLARLTRQPAQLSRVVLAALSEDFDVSSAKAERELGVHFRPVEETLRDTVEWFRANGYA